MSAIQKDDRQAFIFGVKGCKMLQTELFRHSCLLRIDHSIQRLK